MDWLDLLGWAGSALLIYSVLQTRMLRLRLLNLAASLVLTIFNALVEVWPMAAVNAALVVINIVYLTQMMRAKRRGRAFSWIDADADEPYVRWFLDQQNDISQHWPHVEQARTTKGPLCFLMMHDQVTIGVVIAERTAVDSANLLVDYVIPDYRDFTPGKFVYSSSGPLAAAGIKTVTFTGTGNGGGGGGEAYLRRAGFTSQDNTLARTIG